MKGMHLLRWLINNRQPSKGQQKSVKTTSDSWQWICRMGNVSVTVNKPKLWTLPFVVNLPDSCRCISISWFKLVVRCIELKFLDALFHQDESKPNLQMILSNILKSNIRMIFQTLLPHSWGGSLSRASWFDQWRFAYSLAFWCFK